ncbi:unnamed protein product [Ectocarpus sp. 12 AP-2014]
MTCGGALGNYFFFRCYLSPGVAAISSWTDGCCWVFPPRTPRATAVATHGRRVGKYAVVWEERREWRTVFCDFPGFVWWEKESQVLVLVCAILIVVCKTLARKKGARCLFLTISSFSRVYSLVSFFI